VSERDHILMALVKEVLGLRDGPHEILSENQDPCSEYITGVLALAHPPYSPDDIDADIEEVIEEAPSEEDQDTPGYVVVPVVSGLREAAGQAAMFPQRLSSAVRRTCVLLSSSRR
jgi:hypothetical protein